MIFNTGLLQTPAVPTYAAYVVTAGVWRNPVKYFTDKKSRALAKISQNPASNALQVLELFYVVKVLKPIFGFTMYVCLKDFMCLNGSICKMLLGSHASK